MKHGTRTCYVSHKCRCPGCTAANRTYMDALRQRLSATPADEIPHGLGGYTNYLCRCEVCAAANAACSAQWRVDHRG